MSDPKLISPLLDGFSMGNPMSSHDGVVCCPAIKENSDTKYIVKIISIPPTQAQMDALLLAGAYRDPADAMEYFYSLGEDVIKEAELLTTLSKLEGFLGYESWQMEPITRKRLGYQVYLLSTYKRTLEKHVRKNPVTHLEAINLGLDLCAALTVCRQAGALYVDLKPTNIFVSEKKEYRIGDLGFIKLDALSYTSLPVKYRSAYTPPELSDPMASVNLTTDTYAVGMILYQLYNESQLPKIEPESQEPLAAPINADYELAEIILKAIHPDPAQRWENPKAMGQALVGYMQRNVVNDTPITPYTALELAPEPAQKAEDSSAAPEVPEESQPEPSGESEASNEPEASDAPQPEAVPDTAPPDISEQEPPIPADETLPNEEDADSVLIHELSDELSRMIAKADDLISHETPGGVVLPEVPEPADPFAFATEDNVDEDDPSVPKEPLMEDPREKRTAKKERKTYASQKGKKLVKKLVSRFITLLILAAMGLGAFWYYQNYYLQTIDDITIDGDREQLTVAVDTQIDHALLTVTCSDTYGNTLSQSLTDGKATFQELRPNTMYTVQLQIEGFHQLRGKTSEIFTTDTTTSIVSFTTVTGSEDGTILLNFTVDGEEPEEWTVTYSTEGEEPVSQSFEGHSTTLKDLIVGKVYTFTLDAGDKLSLSGEVSKQVMISRMILAQNLTITSDGANDLTVHWETPGDILVDSWDVRCYSDRGYEQQATVTDTQVYFSNIDSSQSYTVEVTAAGMTQPARTSITANPINITDFRTEESNPEELTVTWEHTGNAPEGGWLLLYSVDGSESTDVIRCPSPSAVISPRFHGAEYRFTLQSVDNTSLFNNVHVYTSPEAQPFQEMDVTADSITAQLVRTPSAAGWTFDQMSQEDVTDQFQVGESISAVLKCSVNFFLTGPELNILYVIEDAYGNVLPELSATGHDWWKEFWYAGDYHIGELDIPTVPETPGSYNLKIYFNGAFVAEAPFTITE